MSPSHTSRSSFAKSPGISPVDKIMLMYSKNSSFLTSASVIKKVTFLPKCPAKSKHFLISSFRSFSPKVLVITIQQQISRSISAASLVKDYFPDPPTPTNRPDDLGVPTIREILSRCLKASSKSTRGIFLERYFQLYSSNIQQLLLRNFSMLLIAQYILSACTSTSPSSFLISSFKKSQNRNVLSCANLSYISLSRNENDSNDISEMKFNTQSLSLALVSLSTKVLSHS